MTMKRFIPVDNTMRYAIALRFQMDEPTRVRARRIEKLRKLITPFEASRAHQLIGLEKY